MIIQLTETVSFDTDKEVQSDEFYSYVLSDIAPNLGSEQYPAAQKDNFGRPTLFLVEFESATLRVGRSYISDNGSWAKKADTYSVVEKEVSDGN